MDSAKLLAIADEHEQYARGVEHLDAAEADENRIIAIALREKAARDAAPADQDLTPGELRGLAKWHDGVALDAVDEPRPQQLHRAIARALRFYAAAIDGRHPAAPPAQPASQADDGPRGTYACPICGRETPHGHTEDKIERERVRRPIFERVYREGAEYWRSLRVSGYGLHDGLKRNELWYLDPKLNDLWHFFNAVFDAAKAVPIVAPTPAASSGLAAELRGLLKEWDAALASPESSMPEYHRIAEFVIQERANVQAALALAEAVANPDDATLENVALRIGAACNCVCVDNDLPCAEHLGAARAAVKSLSEGQQR